MHRGRFADVWKCRYQGRDVAAKVLKVRSKDDSGQIKRVGYSWCSRLEIYISN